MILGPNDPRAITDPHELEAARENTEQWRKMLGIKAPTKAQQEADARQLDAILDLIGYEPEPDVEFAGVVVEGDEDDDWMFAAEADRIERRQEQAREDPDAWAP